MHVHCVLKICGEEFVQVKIHVVVIFYANFFLFMLNNSS